MSCKVAVVGTEGTGKTVLMTVWARAFLREQRGISLIPKSSDTSIFVERNWAYLMRGDWPPSTREGSLLQLQWELRVPNAAECTLDFREISGQDFRYLFGDAAIDSLPALPQQLQELANCLAQSQIFVLLVNLADFVGQADIETREKSQWAIKYSLDWLLRLNPSCKCLLLFTQSDLYGLLKDECGGWLNVARQYLPIVYTSHIVTERVQIHAVSAVGNTRLTFDNQGQPRRVPDTEWHCRGLIALSKWIGKHAASARPASELLATGEGGPVMTWPGGDAYQGRADVPSPPQWNPTPLAQSLVASPSASTQPRPYWEEAPNENSPYNAPQNAVTERVHVRAQREEQQLPGEVRDEVPVGKQNYEVPRALVTNLIWAVGLILALILSVGLYLLGVAR